MFYRFFRDLYSWRDVVPKMDRHLFELVIYLVLGHTLEKKRHSSRSNNLHHFQELFQNLLKETAMDEVPSEWLGGTRLSLIQAYHAERSGIAANVESDRVLTPDLDMISHRSEVYKKDWKSHDSRIVKLAATVIFCVVIAVLMCKHDSQTLSCDANCRISSLPPTGPR